MDSLAQIGKILNFKWLFYITPKKEENSEFKNFLYKSKRILETGYIKKLFL